MISIYLIYLCIYLFIYFLCDTGTWTQVLHFEPLHISPFLWWIIFLKIFIYFFRQGPNMWPVLTWNFWSFCLSPEVLELQVWLKLFFFFLKCWGWNPGLSKHLTQNYIPHLIFSVSFGVSTIVCIFWNLFISSRISNLFS
jgi:hypothetical protein